MHLMRAVFFVVGSHGKNFRRASLGLAEIVSPAHQSLKSMGTDVHRYVTRRIGRFIDIHTLLRAFRDLQLFFVDTSISSKRTMAV